MDLQNNVINLESLNEQESLSIIERRLKPGETLVLDIGYNYYHQADNIYNRLISDGYYVRKTLVNGRNQLLVAIKDEKHQMY